MTIIVHKDFSNMPKHISTDLFSNNYFTIKSFYNDISNSLGRALPLNKYIIECELPVFLYSLIVRTF